MIYLVYRFTFIYILQNQKFAGIRKWNVINKCCLRIKNKKSQQSFYLKFSLQNKLHASFTFLSLFKLRSTEWVQSHVCLDLLHAKNC